MCNQKKLHEAIKFITDYKTGFSWLFEKLGRKKYSQKTAAGCGGTLGEMSVC
jgi:hypothetical protein